MTTLRQRYNYYFKKFKEQRIKSQALAIAQGQVYETKPPTLFFFFFYNELYTQGITRKVGNKTVRFTGEEAVNLQIESLKRETNRYDKKQQFIDAYIERLEELGGDTDLIYSIKTKLENTSATKLSILIRQGYIEMPNYMYEIEEIDDFVKDQINNLTKRGYTEKATQIRQNIIELKSIKKKTKRQKTRIKTLEKQFKKEQSKFFEKIKKKQQKAEKIVRQIYGLK